MGRPFLALLPEPISNPISPSARSDHESGRPSAAEDKALLERVLARDQSAMAELLRVRTAALSNAGSTVKNATTQTQQFNQNILGTLMPH